MPETRELIYAEYEARRKPLYTAYWAARASVANAHRARRRQIACACKENLAGLINDALMPLTNYQFKRKPIIDASQVDLARLDAERAAALVRIDRAYKPRLGRLLATYWRRRNQLEKKAADQPLC